MEEVLKLFGGSIIPPLAAALAAWIVKELVSLIQSETAKIDAHCSEQVAITLDAGLRTAQGVVCTLVNAAENPLVEKLKASGKWGTPEAYRQAFGSVLSDAKVHVAAAAPQLAAQFGAGLSSLLTGMIEHEVAKLSNPTTPAAVPAQTKDAA